jgi:hypothetical protein
MYCLRQLKRQIRGMGIDRAPGMTCRRYLSNGALIAEALVFSVIQHTNGDGGRCGSVRRQGLEFGRLVRAPGDRDQLYRLIATRRSD